MTIADNTYPRQKSSASVAVGAGSPAERSFLTSSVSVVIPCLNEERFIHCVLERLAKQYDYENYEIIVVDGMSTDGTREAVTEFVKANADVRVRLIENPARNIPAGLNTGISEARGEVIVRMDAHSFPSENYVSRCLETLTTTDAAVVGMPWKIHPSAETPIARAVAMAVAHPFGSGGAKYRALGTSETKVVDTVPFGVFRKDLWQKLGGFNETLLANEDYEFNYRARNNGGKILLDGSGYCVYFARATVGDLLKQYFRYGLWKAQMVKLHPRSIKLRQLVPALFVIALMLLCTLSFVSPPAPWLLLSLVGLYGLVSAAVCLQFLTQAKDIRATLLLPAVFFAIHMAWGTGFVLGALRWASDSVSQERRASAE